ncbi:MAG: FAD-binding domain-containing protein, partial [Saprospiraceae bacterium]
GFLPFNSRLNVANYFIQELRLPWLQGAEYFESILIDYDPCSNYGNWMNLAGVGTESKIDRPVNLLTQSKRKDPKGFYVSKWTEASSV